MLSRRTCQICPILLYWYDCFLKKLLFSQVDPGDFLDFVTKNPALSDEFCYLNRIGPYDYKVVAFCDLNPKDYLTLSARGVTHTLGG